MWTLAHASGYQPLPHGLQQWLVLLITDYHINKHLIPCNL